MNDPIVTFDTLTIGAEIDALGATGPAAQETPVLARLPRVTPPRPKTINRVDEAESASPTEQLLDSIDGLAAAAIEPIAQPTDGAFTTIRIDTVTPDRVADPAPQPKPAPQPTAPPAMRVIHPADEADADSEMANWLLSLEATILPFSRWIALAAVIAALGLTLVLLRSGGGSEAANSTAPQVSVEAVQNAIAEADEFAPAWLTPTPEPAPATATTLVAQTPPAATASGPASLPRTTTGQAQFTGQVLPVPAAERVNVADARNAASYQRTTNR